MVICQLWRFSFTLPPLFWWWDLRDVEKPCLRKNYIHYCYGAWQDRFQSMQDEGIEFHEGIPEYQDLVQWFPQGGRILVLDDLMDEGSGDKRVLDLFTKHSHHQNVTVLYLCQDMFPVGKYAKSISRNAHYIVAFKNPRDQLGVRNVLLQSCPTEWKTVETRFITSPVDLLVTC